MMHTRFVPSGTVAVAVMLGISTAALAQADSVQFTWDWVTVEAGTSNVISPAVPGAVSPGEGVELRGSFSFTPPVGTVRFTSTASGPVAGVARISADFTAAANHNGFFHSEVVRHPSHGAGPVVEADRVHGIELGQEGITGLPLVYTSNVFENAIVLRWTPSDYSVRTVEFELLKSTASAFAAELYLAVSPQPVTYAVYRIANEEFHGGAVQIQVVPTPAGAALLGVCAVALARRRR